MIGQARGSVWAPARVAALDSNGNAYLFTGSDWQALQAPVPLKGIVITSNKVWGISNDKRVFLVDI